MSEEENLRNRLDMINGNSHYGIMIDTEITKIVRDHIKRLEETKMNATSTENFKDIIAIDFELHTFPNPDEQDKFIVSATNRDDIFEFVFEGPDLQDACRKAGLLTNLEKDQKIRGLEEKVKQLERDNAFDKETADTWSKEYYDLSKKFAKLQEEKDQKIMELEKELHSLKLKKTNLPETPITDAMLVDDYNRLVEENKQLKQENEDLKKHNVAKALKYIEMNNKLRDENEELKYQLMNIQATKEVVEQKINTREGILDQAKKCVCGQREQDYGTPESNFQLIADLWNDYLGITDYVLELEERFMDLNNKGIKVDVNFPKPKTIFPEDVAMMMALMKIARIRNGGGSGDSFVDLAGYAACGGEIWHGGKA